MTEHDGRPTMWGNYAAMGPGPRSFSVLTGRLRWHNGILEQNIAFQDYLNYELVGSREDWIAVPTINDEQEARGG